MNIFNPNHDRKAIVIFSGGQDSTTCLFQAIAEYGKENIEAITFQYGQRHAIELEKARTIAQDLGIKQTLIDTSVMKAITHNALMDEQAHIEQKKRMNCQTLLLMVAMPYFYFMQRFMRKAKAFKILSLAYVKQISAVIQIAEMCLSSQ